MTVKETAFQLAVMRDVHRCLGRGRRETMHRAVDFYFDNQEELKILSFFWQFAPSNDNEPYDLEGISQRDPRDVLCQVKQSKSLPGYAKKKLIRTLRRAV